ncbi:MAG: hypothetical protein KME57_09670 [Scytonema hyalinum WJT4-NPBG1]|nr:hypothetical protein [Scytonema hyalinum WJT4-NPBG1]
MDNSRHGSRFRISDWVNAIAFMRGFAHRVPPAEELTLTRSVSGGLSGRKAPSPKGHFSKLIAFYA